MSDIGVLVTLDEIAQQNRAIIDYTSRDFTSIRAELVGLAKGYIPEWKTVGESADFGTILLELFAYVGDALNFYIDRTASEAFLSTAVRPQSVLYIADMLGYRPVGQSAAAVQLTVTAYTPGPEDPLNDIVVPAGLLVYSGGSANATDVVVFETMSSVTLKPGTSATVAALEGTTVRDRQVGEAFGVPNSEFLLPDRGVIGGSVQVTTAEGSQAITWTYTSDLATTRPTQSAFTTYMDDQGMTHIVFGDNTSGRIPAIGAKVYASYRYGVGAMGNSIPINGLSSFMPDASFDAATITITNPAAPSGGADAESIDSMKHTIPRAGPRIRGRAVTLNDFADLAMQVPGVAKSTAYGTVYTSVHVRIAPILNSSADSYPDEALDSLTSACEIYMADKVLIGATVIMEPDNLDEIWTNLYIRVTVHVNPVYHRANTRNQVDQVLRKILSYSNVDFGTRITLGDLYRAVLTVAGVDWAEIRWLSTNAPVDSAPVQTEILTGTSAAIGPPTSPSATLFKGMWHKGVDTGEPDSGCYRVDDDAAEVDPDYSVIYFSYRDGDNDVRSTDLAKLQIGDHILVSGESPTGQAFGSWWDYVIYDEPTLTPGAGTPATPGFLSAKVLLARHATVVNSPEAGAPMSFDFIRYSPSPVTAGEVADIVTPDIKIPRIEPTEVVEAESPISEVQVLTTIPTVTGGTFTLSLLGVTTGNIAYNATAATIKAAIDLVLPDNTITVTPPTGNLNTQPMTLTYPSSYGNVVQAVVTPTPSPLTGGGRIEPTTTVQGSVAIWADAGFSEAERTHDGLWVIATGGAANS